VEGWLEWLYGEDPERAAQAALWLGASGGGPALEPLCDALTHGDARVRAAALLGLGALGDRAAQPAVLDRLASDPTAMVREAAAQALASIGTQPAIQQLETAARSDPKAKVRKAAVQALAELRARRK
jgi:HEAT repeat protein